MTGLSHARGDLVFLIDSDLEERPELLADFKKEMERTGADVVYGVQGKRRGGAFERMTGAMYYTLFNAITSQRIPRNLLTVRLMTRRYVQALVAHQERELPCAAALRLDQAAHGENLPLPGFAPALGPSRYVLSSLKLSQA